MSEAKRMDWVVRRLLTLFYYVTSAEVNGEPLDHRHVRISISDIVEFLTRDRENQ